MKTVVLGFLTLCANDGAYEGKSGYLIPDCCWVCFMAYSFPPPAIGGEN
jgi:hypothetical protein